MIQLSIARRYARALFESVGSDFDRANKELAGLAKSLDESPEFVASLVSPHLAASERRQILEAIIAAGGFMPVVGNLLRLLEDRRRIGEVPTIARLFSELVDAAEQRVRAKVTSAEALDPATIEALEAALGRATNKKVSVETAIDGDILGGLVAQVGNVVYDGSLRTQLESLRRELTSRA